MGTRSRRRTDAIACVAGLAVTGLAATIADKHPRTDRRLFSLINDHRNEPTAVRIVQQAGTPWVLPATALVALLAGRRSLAVSAAMALPVEKALEVGIKKARPTLRPLHVEPTVLRDDAPVEGESFPSGHAAIAATAVCLLAPHVPVAARVLLFAAAVGTGLARISQGAHHPVDAVAGTALGVAIGSGLRFVVGR
jgi:membrane-associated phospholipid phosphatase